MDRNYKLIISIYNYVLFLQMETFKFFGRGQFRELFQARSFVRVSFHEESNKTNIFAAQIQFFSPCQ